MKPLLSQQISLYERLQNDFKASSTINDTNIFYCKINSFSIIVIKFSYILKPPLLLIGKIFLSKDFKKIKLSIEKNNFFEFDNIYHSTLISSEDKRFYLHFGIDLYAIFRAFFCTFNSNVLQGASTIEQQLVRTISKNYKISITRKIKEQILAIMINSSYTKKQIANTYLNLANVGAFVKIGNNLTKQNQTHAIELIARVKYPEPKTKTNYWLEKIKKRELYVKKRLFNE